MTTHDGDSFATNWVLLSSGQRLRVVMDEFGDIRKVIADSEIVQPKKRPPPLPCRVRRPLIDPTPVGTVRAVRRALQGCLGSGGVLGRFGTLPAWHHEYTLDGLAAAGRNWSSILRRSNATRGTPTSIDRDQASPLTSQVDRGVLKDNGTIPDRARSARTRDELHPDAASKLVVEHKGKRYQRWYFPAEKSNSGKTVHEWDSGWKEIGDVNPPSATE